MASQGNSDTAAVMSDGIGQTLWYRPGCRQHLSGFESQIWAHRWRCVCELQGLMRDPRSPLWEHATVVERLPQVAYGDLPTEGRRSLALEAFLQSVNNIDTMRMALWLGNAYFQANSTCRPGVNSQQAEANDALPPSSAATTVHVA